MTLQMHDTPNAIRCILSKQYLISLKISHLSLFSLGLLSLRLYGVASASRLLKIICLF